MELFGLPLPAREPGYDASSLNRIATAVQGARELHADLSRKALAPIAQAVRDAAGAKVAFSAPVLSAAQQAVAFGQDVYGDVKATVVSHAYRNDLSPLSMMPGMRSVGGSAGPALYDAYVQCGTGYLYGVPTGHGPYQPGDLSVLTAVDPASLQVYYSQTSAWWTSNPPSCPTSAPAATPPTIPPPTYPATPPPAGIVGNPPSMPPSVPAQPASIIGQPSAPPNPFAPPLRGAGGTVGVRAALPPQNFVVANQPVLQVQPAAGNDFIIFNIDVPPIPPAVPPQPIFPPPFGPPPFGPPPVPPLGPPDFCPPSDSCPPCDYPPDPAALVDVYAACGTGEYYTVPAGTYSATAQDVQIAAGQTADAAAALLADGPMDPAPKCLDPCGGDDCCKPYSLCEPQDMRLESYLAWPAGIDSGDFRASATAWLGKTYAAIAAFATVDDMLAAFRKELESASAGDGSQDTGFPFGDW